MLQLQKLSHSPTRKNLKQKKPPLMRIQSSSTWWFLKVNLLKLEFLIHGLPPPPFFDVAPPFFLNLHPLKEQNCTPLNALSITPVQPKTRVHNEPSFFFCFLSFSRFSCVKSVNKSRNLRKNRSLLPKTASPLLLANLNFDSCALKSI